ncbi:hypothetical protein BHF70_02085 [Anaerostipes sp. 494a]|uniref:hypothetical protein n=1 Tax=Anaerostipes sp. 494a TaxID=1261636 RepID=UPI000951A923|nr:hypothetical protein [Anaerostipes sp. 494a]OLR58513.1 hypothetical protein BHF70_02085 [Anaerostipes sp. 494a]
MKVHDWISKKIVKKVLMVIVCLVIALLSIFVVAKYTTNPESYKNTIQSIDEKKATVMGVTATAAAVSTGLAAIPGDATTPIANQIMDISSYLLIVVCALVLEKSLLTVLGFLAFKILVPFACVLFAISIFTKRSLLKVLGIKFVVFAFVIATIIPFSLKISDMIYETNETMLTELTEKTKEIEKSKKEEKESKKWWEIFTDKIEKGASDASEKAKQILNSFIDTMALFIIAYCAIPVIVFLVVIWFVKFLFNITIPVPLKGKMQGLNKIEKENLCKEN